MATCSECRHKRRKFAQKASAAQKDLQKQLEEENQTLRATLEDQNKQLTEARQWQNEAQRLSQQVTNHKFEIKQLQNQLLLNGSQPPMYHSPLQPVAPYAAYTDQPQPVESEVQQDCYAAHSSQTTPVESALETHTIGYPQFYQKLMTTQPVPKWNAPYADSRQLEGPHPELSHLYTNPHAEIPANQKRFKLEETHAFQPLKTQGHGGDYYGQEGNYADNHAKSQLPQARAIICDGAAPAVDDEGTLLDAACDAFDDINEPFSLSHSVVGMGQGSGVQHPATSHTDQAESSGSPDISSLSAQSCVQQAAASGSVLEQSWQDLLWACIGFGFEPKLEAAYDTWRSKERFGGLMLISLFNLFRTAQFTVSQGAFLAAIYTQDWMFLFPLMTAVQGFLLLCFLSRWSMDSTAQLPVRYHRILPLVTMAASGLMYASIYRGVCQGSFTRGSQLTELIRPALFRTLSGFIFFDIPVWWTMCMMLATGGYMLLLSPTSTLSRFMEALNDVNDGAVLRFQIVACLIAAIWVQWSRRAQFIHALHIIRGQNLICDTKLIQTQSQN